MNVLRQLLIWIYRLFYFIQSYIYVKPIKPNIYKLYLEKEKKMFLDKYDSSLNDNVGSLYNFEESAKMMNESNNDLEKLWKTRILYQTVTLKNDSKVNVLMYYDPYKQGFTYYCDNLVDYDALNILAMKYVRYFQCMEFFVDERILSEVDGKSVFLEHIKKDKIKSRITKKYKKQPGEELIKNKFIHLGKMLNFTWLKKEKQVVKNIGYRKFKELFN